MELKATDQFGDDGINLESVVINEDVAKRLIFWHELEKKSRSCLVIRLGFGCSILSSKDLKFFAQIIVSMINHGVQENGRITLLVDCEDLTPLGFPMQLILATSTHLQKLSSDAFESLFIINLSSATRKVVEPFLEELKPETRLKVQVCGDYFDDVLSVHLQSIPYFLGGRCKCSTCETLVTLENKDKLRMERERFLDMKGTVTCLYMDVLLTFFIILVLLH